jgi:hypothetical protein
LLAEPARRVLIQQGKISFTLNMKQAQQKDSFQVVLEQEYNYMTK